MGVYTLGTGHERDEIRVLLREVQRGSIRDFVVEQSENLTLKQK